MSTNNNRRQAQGTARFSPEGIPAWQRGVASAHNSASSPTLAPALSSPGYGRPLPPSRTFTPHTPLPPQPQWVRDMPRGFDGVPVVEEAANNDEFTQPFEGLDPAPHVNDDFDISEWINDDPENPGPSFQTSGLPIIPWQSAQEAVSEPAAPAANMHEAPVFGNESIAGYRFVPALPSNVGQGRMPSLEELGFDVFAPMFNDPQPSFEQKYPSPTVHHSQPGSAYPVLDHKVDRGKIQPRQPNDGPASVFGAEGLSFENYDGTASLPHFAGDYDAQQQVTGAQNFVNGVDTEYIMTQNWDRDLSQLSTQRQDPITNQISAQHDSQFEQTARHNSPPSTMQNNTFNNSGHYSSGHSHQPQQGQPYQSIEQQDQRCYDCGATDSLQHASCYYNPLTKTSWILRAGTNEHHTQVHDHMPIYPRNIQYTNQALSPQLQESRTPFSPVFSDTLSARASSQPGPSRSATARQSSVYKKTAGTGRKFQCVDCVDKGSSRWYVETASTGENRCRRCYNKWSKKQNEHNPPDYSYDPNMATFEVAQEKIYGHFRPLVLRRNDDKQDDWQHFVDAEAEWVSRFIAAAVRPFDQGGLDTLDSDAASNETTYKWLQDQQIAFNRAQHEKTGGHWYTNEHINVRFVMLFYAILNLHRGGPRPYPQGGSNSGYGKVDESLTCGERLVLVERILGMDKRIVMNVVEGAHVCVLAENPGNVMKRKSSNKNTNLKKAGLTALGKRAVEEEEERRRREGLVGVGEEDEGGRVGFGEREYEEVVGKGKKRSRFG